MKWETGTSLDTLPGKVITAIEIRLDRVNGDSMKITTSGGEVIAIDLYADCCSETWFANIENTISGPVVAIEELDVSGHDVNDGRGRQDEDTAYGFRIVGEVGAVDVIYRNSSNGYYGGWMQTAGDLSGAEWINVGAEWASE